MISWAFVFTCVISVSNAVLLMPSREDRRIEGTSIMLNCIEKDIDILRWKVEHIMKAQNFNFTERVLVIDSHGDVPSDKFMKVVNQTIKDNIIDKFLVVDYSKKNVAAAKKRFGWDTDYVRCWDAGNLVYDFMFDRCRTKYMVHFDLDMVVFSDGATSWVRNGTQMLQMHPDTFYLKLSNPGMTGDYTDKYTCKSSSGTWLSSQSFMMDMERYDELQRLLEVDYPEVKKSCAGDRYVEQYLSCSVCALRDATGRTDFARMDLEDTTWSWVLHFPDLKSCGAKDWIVENMIGHGFACTSDGWWDGAPMWWQAGSPEGWLKKARELNLTNVPESC